MTITESQALLKIMKAVATPGELATDGECLDEIIFILEELGMPVQEEINKARAQYDDGTYTVENDTEGDK